MIIYVDMVGDLFHSGHINFLKRAAALGNTLIVGIMSDEDTKSYKRTPIIPLKDRCIVIESCKYVDKIISAPPLIITKKFIDKYNIDLVVHAHNKEDTNYNFMYKIPMSLGIFKRLDYTYGISTTAIIKRIQNI
jgi:cytidyltransferase-like protein